MAIGRFIMAIGRFIIDRLRLWPPGPGDAKEGGEEGGRRPPKVKVWFPKPRRLGALQNHATPPWRPPKPRRLGALQNHATPPWRPPKPRRLGALQNHATLAPP